MVGRWQLAVLDGGQYGKGVELDFREDPGNPREIEFDTFS
jgi:hypothetical protein